MAYMTETEITNEIEYLEGWKAEISAMYEPGMGTALQRQKRDEMVILLEYKITRLKMMLIVVRKTK